MAGLRSVARVTFQDPTCFLNKKTQNLAFWVSGGLTLAAFWAAETMAVQYLCVADVDHASKV